MFVTIELFNLSTINKQNIPANEVFEDTIIGLLFITLV